MRDILADLITSTSVWIGLNSDSYYGAVFTTEVFLVTRLDLTSSYTTDFCEGDAIFLGELLLDGAFSGDALLLRGELLTVTLAGDSFPGDDFLEGDFLDGDADFFDGVGNFPGEDFLDGDFLEGDLGTTADL